MNRAEALVIFENINDDETPDEKKGEAIQIVLGMATHNSITKDQMMRVIGYLFNLCFEETDDMEVTP